MTEITEAAEAQLRAMVSYDAETGHFTWLQARGPRSKGAVAGTRDPNGYIRVTVGGRWFYAHRLAWFFIHGEMPDVMIDHINGERSDNRIANLRLAPGSLNQQNRAGPQANGKVPFLGVSFCKRTGRYRAQISSPIGKRSLGYHDTPEAASEAYQRAKRQLHPETFND